MKILITGAAGQDGSILARDLISQNHEVLGIAKSSNALYKDFWTLGVSRVESHDLANSKVSEEILDAFQPAIIFHLAAVHTNSLGMSSLGDQMHNEMTRCHVNIATNIMDWQVKNTNSKLIVALSSQIFSPTLGSTGVVEESIPAPSSIYGYSKLAAWEAIKSYREKHGLWAAGAILFNHTSEHSKPGYLFPTLAAQLAQQFDNPKVQINVKDVNAIVDFTSAYDVCEGMWRMSHLNQPADFVFASGKPNRIADLINEAQNILRLPISHFSQHKSDSRSLYGDISKARDQLDWNPKTSPAELLAKMTLALRNGA